MREDRKIINEIDERCNNFVRIFSDHSIFKGNLERSSI